MLLSVLTPSYNYDRFLRDALSSVAALGRVGAVEHVVVDDGSTDASWNTLRAWPGDLVLQRQPNSGLSATLNAALALAKGEWVGWLNADDFYLPGVVEFLAAVSDPDVTVVYGDSAFVDAEARLLRLAPQHSFSRRVLRRYGPFIAPPAMFVRRSALSGYSFDETLIKLMDWDLYLHLAQRGGSFQYMPRTVATFRRHDEQQSNRVTPRAETLRVRARYELPTSPGVAQGGYRLGELEHAAMKWWQGSYRRQSVARSFAGSDLRWWASTERAESVRDFQAVVDLARGRRAASRSENSRRSSSA